MVKRNRKATNRSDNVWKFLNPLQLLMTQNIEMLLLDIEITIEIGLFNSHSEKMWVDSPNTNIFNI